MPSDAPIPLPAANGLAVRGMLFADPDGHCTQVDSGWTELTGSEPALNIGDGWLDLVHPDDLEGLRAQWIACVRTPTEISVPLRMLSPEGRIRHVVLAASPAPVESGAAPGFVVTLTETGPRNQESELAQARKMEAVGRLASGLAHDFANLLTLICGYSEIVLAKLPAHDPLRSEVDEIRNAANRGSGLTRQLLEFSRRHPVAPQALDLNALVADMQKMLRRMIGEHIDLLTHLSADLGCVMADRGQLEQVIMNLAINARDAMPRGGRIVIRTRNLDLDASHARAQQGLPAGAYVMLTVDDTGQGMDQETLSHLFEPFFTTKDSGRGTGLGLSTVYGIIKQGCGDVWAESKPAHGTTFTILLPRMEGEARPAAQQVPAARAASSGTETILLVEDEDGVRRLLQHVLGKQGYTVLEAANGPEALVVFQQHKQTIDLLLTDIVMPRMNGRELADRLVKLQPGLKVIFMSGYTDEVLAGTGALQPGALFLQKPLRPDVLASRVREVLDGTTCLTAAQRY